VLLLAARSDLSSRLSYPFSGCSSAEPESVSLNITNINRLLTQFILHSLRKGFHRLCGKLLQHTKLNGPVQQTVNPGTTLDTTAGALGFGMGNNWFTVYNTGSPVSASVTFRMFIIKAAFA
jgi:hypothetical protein